MQAYGIRDISYFKGPTRTRYSNKSQKPPPYMVYWMRLQVNTKRVNSSLCISNSTPHCLCYPRVCVNGNGERETGTPCACPHHRHSRS